MKVVGIYSELPEDDLFANINYNWHTSNIKGLRESYTSMCIGSVTVVVTAYNSESGRPGSNSEWRQNTIRFRSLHRAYLSLHPSGVAHWVPEQLNIKAVTGAGKLIDGCSLVLRSVTVSVVSSRICHKNEVNSTVWLYRYGPSYKIVSFTLHYNDGVLIKCILCGLFNPHSMYIFAPGHGDQKHMCFRVWFEIQKSFKSRGVLQQDVMRDVTMTMDALTNKSERNQESWQESWQESVIRSWREFSLRFLSKILARILERYIKNNN